MTSRFVSSNKANVFRLAQLEKACDLIDSKISWKHGRFKSCWAESIWYYYFESWITRKRNWMTLVFIEKSASNDFKMKETELAEEASIGMLWHQLFWVLSQQEKNRSKSLIFQKPIKKYDQQNPFVLIDEFVRITKQLCPD